MAERSAAKTDRLTGGSGVSPAPNQPTKSTDLSLAAAPAKKVRRSFSNLQSRITNPTMLAQSYHALSYVSFRRSASVRKRRLRLQSLERLPASSCVKSVHERSAARSLSNQSRSLSRISILTMLSRISILTMLSRISNLESPIQPCSLESLLQKKRERGAENQGPQQSTRGNLKKMRRAKRAKKRRIRASDDSPAVEQRPPPGIGGPDKVPRFASNLPICSLEHGLSSLKSPCIHNAQGDRIHICTGCGIVARGHTCKKGRVHYADPPTNAAETGESADEASESDPDAFDFGSEDFRLPLPSMA